MTEHSRTQAHPAVNSKNISQDKLQLSWKTYTQAPISQSLVTGSMLMKQYRTILRHASSRNLHSLLQSSRQRCKSMRQTHCKSSQTTMTIFDGTGDYLMVVQLPGVQRFLSTHNPEIEGAYKAVETLLTVCARTLGHASWYLMKIFVNSKLTKLFFLNLKLEYILHDEEFYPLFQELPFHTTSLFWTISESLQKYVMIMIEAPIP